MADKIVALVIVLSLFVAYVAAPPLIAWVRKHPERKLIYKLTPLTLLSFLLWVALIGWAASDRRDDAVISRYVAKLRESGRLPWAIAVVVLVGLAGSLVTLSMR